MNFFDEAGATFQGLFGTGDWVPLVLLFGAVFFATFAAAGMLRSRSSIRQRVSRSDPRSKRKVSLRQQVPDSALHQVLKGLEKHVAPKIGQEHSGVGLLMIHAGFLDETAVRIYYSVRVLLAVTLPVGFLLLAPALAPDMPLEKMLAIALGLCAAGLYLPYRYVASRIESRKRVISEGFPDALDMLVVCVEAGLGLDAALVRVGGQIARPHPVLAEHFAQVAMELRAGKSRAEALRNLATRTGVQDVSTFVILLIQSEALGADLSQTLRVQADEMRANRMLIAEEKAHKLPVKLSIPLVLCILPAMFAVVLGPGLIDIVRNVLPHLGK